ncbi:MAG: IS110 family transposase [Tateyamaria sp.]|jgi:transposase|uniref:IS110 family transposase n=1 Tax=Tateyamaria sp. TaxID=1929288 RepID=UPI0032DCAA59|tara:strand:+ start:16968 stop:17993 length:1026 start_codon:yes stop_codon:yes gene_type:complete
MKRYFVGLDVSKDATAVCLRDDRGNILMSFKKPTDPDVLTRALGAEMEHIVCVVLETGRMANWLYGELSQRGLPMVCIDARQAHAVLSQMHNKTDENDAAMLSELARTGFYKKIEVKSRLAQERRALLRAREVATKMRMNAENRIRGLLASFGIRLPKHLKTYEQRVQKVLEGQAVLAGVIEPLLKLRTEALRQTAVLTKEMTRHSRDDEACRRLMTIPGVGAVSAVTFVATIDTPDRFKRSRSVGAYIGLTSRRYQSGDIDYGGRISKRGDRMLRTVLYEAANSLLCPVKSGPGQALKDWATALKKRTSHKKAVVALARKLAVIMHAIWKDGTEFEMKEA